MTDEELAQSLSDNGFCTHYPGYTCDKGFPTACTKCILRWLNNHPKAKEELMKKEVTV